MTDSTPASLLSLSILSCSACPARAEARLPVPFTAPQAQPSGVMLVGRNPGQNEDACGQAFIGESGALLNRTLAALGIDRARLTVTNAVKCHTTKNRVPDATEYAECHSRHLVREFQLFKPDLVVTLGRDAFRQVTCDERPIGKARQRFFDAPHQPFFVVAIQHPSAALREVNRMAEWAADWLWLSKTEAWKLAYAERA